MAMPKVPYEVTRKKVEVEKVERDAKGATKKKVKRRISWTKMDFELDFIRSPDWIPDDLEHAWVESGFFTTYVFYRFFYFRWILPTNKAR